ncbi:MAG: hypothetical protein AB7I30_07290 [Isosphaeraceae bacterium]
MTDARSEPDDPSVSPSEDEPITVTEFARETAGPLIRLASVGQAGVVIFGGLLGLSQSPQALAPGASAGLLLGLVARVGLAIVAGLVVGHLLRGLGALLLTVAEQAEATAKLARLSDGSLARPVGAASAATGLSLKAADLAEIRQAIRAGRWAEAQDFARAFRDAHPEDADSDRIVEELAAARQAAADDLLVRIEAAREVNDPDRVIELRDELKPLLEQEPLRTLDRDLARWFMTIIQRRLRAGTVRNDVATLAGRVAASLDDTPEGASLRASLPTLRRAAGLCPRCAEPYLGTANACPACVAAAKVGPPASPTPLPATPPPTDSP